MALLAQRLLDIPYSPQTPTDKQASFLLDFTHRDLLFGGSGGPGKSSSLLMGALQFTPVPGYAALLLRRSMKDFEQPGSLMERADEWLRPHVSSGLVKWIDKRSSWEFTCLDANERYLGRSFLQFGYMNNDSDRFRYQSSEYCYIGYDELTQFTETGYRYTFSRLRKPEGTAATNPLAAVPLRQRAASNPGGVGHSWVKRRFIDSPAAGTRFIPARISDNPHINRAEYEKSLSYLDPVTRRQIMDGDWEVRESGGYFSPDMFDNRWLDTPIIAVRRVRYWDLAATEANEHNDPDYSVGTRLALLSDGRLVVEDVQRFRKNPAGTEAHVKAVAQMDGPGVSIYIEQEPGSAGKQLISNWSRHILPNYHVAGHAKTRSKEEMIVPVSARASQGDILVVRGSWNSDWLDELTAFPAVGHDDQCLVGETLITTPAGDRRIDEIRAGDIVLGQSGWVDVLDAAMTSPSAEVSTRFGLTATAGHPIWTEADGFVPFLKVAHDARLRGIDSTFTSPSTCQDLEAPRFAAVYNLTTSDGTYYANRILVHNCDSLSGAFHCLTGGRRARLIV